MENNEISSTLFTALYNTEKRVPIKLSSEFLLAHSTRIARRMYNEADIIRPLSNDDGGGKRNPVNDQTTVSLFYKKQSDYNRRETDVEWEKAFIESRTVALVDF